MPTTNLPLLDGLPEAAVRVSGGAVTYKNAAARALLPGLEEGGALPESMALPGAAGQGAGVFTAEGRAFAFSVSRAGEERLILFRPAPPPILTAGEMEGVVRQLRALLGDVMAEMGPLTARGAEAPQPRLQADFTKSFHRLARLADNLDFVCRAGGGGELLFRPVTMDLAGLCREFAQRAGDLLRYTNTKLWYDSPLTSLLVPGDPALLRRMLLELTANSARAARGGTITLSLALQEGRAVFSITDSGGPLSPREKNALLLRPEHGEAPLSGAGAGLGLSIARAAAALHRGALLVDLGEKDVPTVLVSLPTGPMEPSVTVRMPAAGTDGGLDPMLVGLSDVLPAECFTLEGLD